ncbi:TlpA family protein disulfide reductase [Sphingobacterium pedocola]|uniref:Protein-disulfide isomerase n=1 Tax=Sphingobacterium pedocola TaxID=2082722 RepID=A0ABR9TA76_9SPHI|nr:TlpA disulfide reductase family protein [Sphingobacterium pedocola]MBE8722185.1 protein-disulfide isomerase [Sphingobacterium pedocola]
MKKLVVYLFICLCLTVDSNAQEWKIGLNETVPPFEVVQKDGTKTNAEALKGKVVLINFFATWCPPCRAELPRLQAEIWERWKSTGDFHVLVLAREEGWDKLDPFMAANNYTFPVFPDMERAIFRLFAENTIPRNVLLNREGEVIYQSIGYESKEFDKLIRRIDDELKK